MSNKIEFIVPGKAQAKQRPKFNRFSGRAYTPKQTISFEKCDKTYKKSLEKCERKD